MFSLCLCLRLCDCNDVSAVGEVQERSDVAGWICRLFLSYSPYVRFSFACTTLAAARDIIEITCRTMQTRVLGEPAILRLLSCASCQSFLL